MPGCGADRTHYTQAFEFDYMVVVDSLDPYLGRTGLCCAYAGNCNRSSTSEEVTMKVYNLGVGKDYGESNFFVEVGVKYDDTPIMPRVLRVRFPSRVMAEQYVRRFKERWERRYGRISQTG